MEAIIKKHFWTVNLVFLAIGAWLLANMTNVVIAHKLRPLPSLPKTAAKQKKTRRSVGQAENNGVIVERNFFESAMAVPEDANGDAGLDESSAEALMEGNGVVSTLRAALVGTIVAEDTKWSMAMITDLAASETDVYRVDQRVMEEATVVAILSRKVILNHGGVLEYLELQEKAEPKTHRPGKMPHHTTAGSDKAGKGIKKLGQDKWAIDRDEIDKTLSNLNSIAMQARIVPSFKNGEANGFKLFAIRPNSLYSKLGIQNGDIIHKINGFAINSPDKALEIYQKLKNARSIDIELTRRGKSKKLNYSIQ